MSVPLAHVLELVVALTLVRAVLRAVARPLASGILLGGLLMLVGVLSPATATIMLATGVRWLVRLYAVVVRTAAAAG